MIPSYEQTMRLMARDELVVSPDRYARALMWMLITHAALTCARIAYASHTARNNEGVAVRRRRQKDGSEHPPESLLLPSAYTSMVNSKVAQVDVLSGHRAWTDELPHLHQRHTPRQGAGIQSADE